MIRVLLLATFLAGAQPNEAEPTFARPEGATAEVLDVLNGVAASSSLEELQQAASKGASLIARQSPVAATLSQLAKDNLSADDLRAKLIEVRDGLAFEPLREADLPADFPTYTPPGIVELKTYPKSRRAVSDEFLSLFAHITRNKIAMTAPVRMEYRPDDAGKLKQENMAFFYGDAQTGTLGADPQDNGVNTVGDDGQTVVALGQRGRWNREIITQGERLLRDWLKDHPDYEASGEVAVMGYNSPMTPTARQFFEIQLPVEKVDQ